MREKFYYPQGIYTLMREITSNSTINQNRIKAKAVQGNFTYLVLVI